MSDRLKCTDKVSNDEIIDDLTKDLQSALRTDEKTVQNSEEPETPGSSERYYDTESPTDIPTRTDVPSDDDHKTKLEQPDVDYASKILEEGEGEDSDTDSFNDETLKDAELDLNEDQKEERRIIAEELKAAGNNAFKDRDYERSIEKYTEGLKICPLKYSRERAVLYCNRSAAKMQLQRYKQSIKDCTKAIELDDKYVKAYIRRAQSYEAKDKLDESLADFKKILELDPSHKEAHKAIARLTPLIEEKNEKLKTEMLGKLKDLGNMILKPFGLSTENFQMEQDPESKGYKINFKQ